MDLDEITKNHGLKFDKDGLCYLKAEGESLSLERSMDGHHFFFHALVGTPPIEKRKWIWELALSGNLFGKETGYGTLAFDASADALVLFDRMPLADLDEEGFLSRLGQFVHYLKHWKGVIANPSLFLSPDFSLASHMEGLIGDQNLEIIFA